MRHALSPKPITSKPKVRLSIAALAFLPAIVGAMASVDKQACPTPVPYPSDEVIRTTLKSGGTTGTLATAYQRFIDAQAKNLQQDPANLCRFKTKNAAQSRDGRPAAILIGDSITESWLSGSPELRNLGYVSRGISNQTTAEVRTRFRQDVLALRPKVVHILAGTNNIAGIGRPFDRSQFKSDIMAMIREAKKEGIAVVLGSILPVQQYPWQLHVEPRPTVKELNGWLRYVARQERVAFADYYSVLVSGSGGMIPSATNDGVHPNLRGYRLMNPLLVSAVGRARRGEAPNKD